MLEPDAPQPIEGPQDSPAASTERDQPEPVRNLRELPREVGTMLVSVGVLGFVLPGMMGTPALIAGGLVLWPKAFSRVDNWFQRRYPALHQQGMQQVCRYLDDLERRFPDGLKK